MNDLIDDIESMGIDIEDIATTNEKLQNEAKEAGLYTVKEKEEQEKTEFRLTAENRHLAVRLNIVPRAFENASFDTEQIKANLIDRNKNRKIKKKVFRFDQYERVCNGILSSIRLGHLPTRSYIIGAESGFGKASFVNECLITLLKHGYRVCPYISLVELATIQRRDSDILLKRALPEIHVAYVEDNDGNNTKLVSYKDRDDYVEVFKDGQKAPEIYLKRQPEIGKIYNYMDYINADCLFVQLSGEGSKELESYELYQLLNIRGAKGIPTIVMTNRSLQESVYFRDIELKDKIWDQIIANEEKDNCYDRLFHVSCWTGYKSNIGSKGESVDPDTGIIR